jgi:hypothetical protein
LFLCTARHEVAGVWLEDLLGRQSEALAHG